MPLSDHIQITTTISPVGPSAPGYGVPLILSANAPQVNRVRFYNNLQAVAADYAVATMPEYLAAAAMFAQNPAPSQIAIGRCANKPTQVYVAQIASLVANTNYELLIKGQGVTPTTVSVNSGGAPANDTVIGSLLTAVNAIVGANFTATATGSSGSHVLTITGNAAGNWFSVEILDGSAQPSTTAPTLWTISQTHADPGVTADLTAILAETTSWYAIYSLYNSHAYVAAIAAWTESNGKLYCAEVNETAAITTVVGNGDTIDALHTSAYTRTFGVYHHSTYEMMGAAWLGAVLPTIPGSEDWKWHTLAGPTPSDLTATHRTNLTARQGNAYQNVGGIGITWEGTDASGQFLDVIRGIDWVDSTMQVNVYDVFLAAAARGAKVPYTDQGIAMIEAAVRATVKQGVANGIFRPGTDTYVVPTAASQAAGDIAARTLRNLSWAAKLAGSVHDVVITGNVSF